MTVQELVWLLEKLPGKATVHIGSISSDAPTEAVLQDIGSVVPVDEQGAQRVLILDVDSHHAAAKVPDIAFPRELLR
jgi:hypothetical protein